MARIVLPLFGPWVPVISSAFGFADGFRLQVPRSGLVPAVTGSWSPLTSSRMVVRTSSGNFFPASSAADGCQVPSRASWLASSPQATDVHQTTRAQATNSVCCASLDTSFRESPWEIGANPRVMPLASTDWNHRAALGQYAYTGRPGLTSQEARSARSRSMDQARSGAAAGTSRVLASAGGGSRPHDLVVDGVPQGIAQGQPFCRVERVMNAEPNAAPGVLERGGAEAVER